MAGHRAGADAVRRVVESSPAAGIGVLTLYSFSSDNWQRPAPEVKALMSLFQSYLRMETRRCVAEGVRIRMIGRRDRLAPALRKAVAEAEAVNRVTLPHDPTVAGAAGHGPGRRPGARPDRHVGLGPGDY